MPTTPATSSPAIQIPADAQFGVITLFVESSKLSALNLRQGTYTGTQEPLEDAIKSAIYASHKTYNNKEDLVNDLTFFKFNLPLVCTFISQTMSISMDALMTGVPVMIVHHFATKSWFLDIMPSVSSGSVQD